MYHSVKYFEDFFFIEVEDEISSSLSLLLHSIHPRGQEEEEPHESPDHPHRGAGGGADCPPGSLHSKGGECRLAPQES